MPEQRNSRAEVMKVSSRGFRLLLGTEELFVPFSEFPWFKDVPIAKLSNVERPQPHQLHWPDLDVDLAVESIRNPGEFPLMSKRS